LRFIAGDFNQSHMGISSMEHWADKGWVNVQWWAFQKFQRLPVSTCKGATIRDHIFVSPELAMYLEDVEVDESFFKDHAIVFAKLASLGQPAMMPLWKHPKQIGKKYQPCQTIQQFQRHRLAWRTDTDRCFNNLNKG
jgi:hypothetical protein